MKVYALKNTKVPFWLPPFVKAEDPETVKNGYIRLCIIESAKAKEMHWDECQLYYIADFDDSTGKLTVLDEPDQLVDLCGCFPKEAK